MISDLFTVFDVKARTYCKPFCAENLATAIRAFAHAANDQTTEIGRYPEDFILYHLGAFDDQSAQYQLQQAPIELARAHLLLKGE